uniref:Uncharacterized protein n=1 Tax=Setaria italica TaxID=4555 RepID=K3XP61_SETIT
MLVCSSIIVQDCTLTTHERLYWLVRTLVLKVMGCQGRCVNVHCYPLQKKQVLLSELQG